MKLIEQFKTAYRREKRLGMYKTWEYFFWPSFMFISMIAVTVSTTSEDYALLALGMWLALIIITYLFYKTNRTLEKLYEKYREYEIIYGDLPK